MKISVILAAYNAQKTIQVCIESVLNQTYQDWELIVIDDGSTDKTGEIIASFCDARIHSYTQKNQGVSVARNLGIEKATGEFFTFLDSDDCFHEEMLRYLIFAQEESKSDIVQCDFFTVHEMNREKKEVNYSKPETISSFEANLRLSQAGGEAYSVVWNKLYRKSLFDRLRFTPNIRYEDEDLLYQLYDKANSITVLDVPLYFYYVNPNGFMNTQFSEHKLDFVSVFEKKMIYFKGKSEELYLRTGSVLCYSLIQLYSSLKKGKDKQDVGRLYKKYLPSFKSNSYIQGMNKMVVVASSVSLLFLDLYRIRAFYLRRKKHD